MNQMEERALKRLPFERFITRLWPPGDVYFDATRSDSQCRVRRGALAQAMMQINCFSVPFLLQSYLDADAPHLPCCSLTLALITPDAPRHHL